MKRPLHTELDEPLCRAELDETYRRIESTLERRSSANPRATRIRTFAVAAVLLLGISSVSALYSVLVSVPQVPSVPESEPEPDHDRSVRIHRSTTFQTTETPPAPREEPESLTTEAPISTDPTPNEDRRTSVASPGWRELVEQGRYDAAFEQIEGPRFGREVRTAMNVDTLFALADSARLSGHPSEACLPLERIVTDHATDSRAAMAAFTLGRIELEARSRPEMASRWFERALELGLDPTLEHAARLRLSELQTNSDPE